MKLKTKIYALACMATVMLACNKKKEKEMESLKKNSYETLKANNDMIGYLTEYYGFYSDKIQETDKALVVSDDIVFLKEDFWDTYGLSDGKTTDPRALRYYSKLTNKKTYYIDIVTNKNTINDDWEASMKSAASEYNALGLGITFGVSSTGASANTVVVSVGSTIGGAPAQASFPNYSTGAIGKSIIINTSANSNPSSWNRKRILMHELGHQVGLVHPGDNGTKVITGYSTCDNNTDTETIMWAGKTGLFTDCDKKTLKVMYP